MLDGLSLHVQNAWRMLSEALLKCLNNDWHSGEEQAARCSMLFDAVRVEVQQFE